MLTLLASGCASEQVAIAPETAVPCRALTVVVVRPAAAQNALSDRTVVDIEANNAAIEAGCRRR